MVIVVSFFPDFYSSLILIVTVAQASVISQAVADCSSDPHMCLHSMLPTILFMPLAFLRKLRLCAHAHLKTFVHVIYFSACAFVSIFY